MSWAFQRKHGKFSCDVKIKIHSSTQEAEEKKYIEGQ